MNEKDIRTTVKTNVRYDPNGDEIEYDDEDYGNERD